MKLTITGGLLEHIRDALDDVVEGNAPALVGMDLTKATLEIGDRDPAVALMASSFRQLLPNITITSADKQEVAKYNEKHGLWERLRYCDDCDAEEWSEHAEWDHHCTTQPACCDPEGWRE